MDTSDYHKSIEQYTFAGLTSEFQMIVAYSSVGQMIALYAAHLAKH